MQIVYYILIFYGGVFAGFFLRTWVLKMYSRRTGTIFVTDDQGMKTFLLELDRDPEEIENENIVIFRVRKDAPDDRD